MTKMSRNIGIFFLLYIFFFLCLYKFINVPVFDTDEGDLFAGGFALSSGVSIYKDFLIQHMPFSYFVSAFFWKLGADSVFYQRICFYILIAGFWTYFVLRFNKVFSKISILLGLIIFLLIMPTIPWGTQILADQLTALGFLIFYFEILKYQSSPKILLSIEDSLLLAVALLFTFGSTFVSAFGVFVIFVSFLFCYFKKKDSKNFLFVVKDLFIDLKYSLLIIIFPWLLLLAYFTIKGTLSDVIYWSYDFNREIYANYLGFGDSILKAIALCIQHNANFVISFIEDLLSAKLNYNSFIHVLIYFCSIIFVFKHFLNKNYFLSIVSSLLLIFLSNRGLFNFHSHQHTALVCLLCSIFCVDVITNSKNFFSKCASAFIILLMPFSYLSDISYYPKFEDVNIVNEQSKIIKRITTEGDIIWDFALATHQITIDSQRPQSMNINTPWYWDATGLEVIINKKPYPKVILFNEKQIVWNHSIEQYAPELIDFVSKNYIHYKDFIYIRKDYYKEAMSIEQNFSKIATN